MPFAELETVPTCLAISLSPARQIRIHALYLSSAPTCIYRGKLTPFQGLNNVF
jgi:hypothetical protein